ncbi:hypothetical protein SAMN03159376_02048 [Pseudomonas sp. NFACC09-4]|uniref:hypothetical protein n=1 Tax=Pseudomonas sp. NFACC09-4 TaxID=1566237 RepID=UPI000908734E|nr:hypothetical protein [Pseudomonas sp. NFACC09-4]SFW53671.1 hypothetical protein SAMN03159376_02048 [Pseudomonas sp. NFACC09-4]
MNSQWKLVPVEPTETMLINGFESVPNECFTDDEVWEQYQEMSGCQQAAFRAKLCWAAMINSAPAPSKADAQPVMKLEAEKLWGGHGEYAVSFVRAGWLDECRATGGEFLLYTHPDEGKVARLTAERDALQLRLNAADQRIDELTQRKAEPVEWGAPKTVRQLIQQLETLDQELRPLSMLRVPGDVFEDGKERTRAVHLSFSYERVDGQWLAPFKGDGEKVLAFWCRTERPATAFGFPVVLDPTLAPNEMRLVQPAPVAAELADRSPERYAIEHAEYMAKSADDVLAKFQAYGLALLAVDEGDDDEDEGELFENIDSTRGDLQEALAYLRGMVHEFRKRSNRCPPL